MKILIKNNFKHICLFILFLSLFSSFFAQNNQNIISFQKRAERKIQIADSLNKLYPYGNYPHLVGGPKTTGPEQDCMGAVSVCQQTYSQANSYTGYGTTQEVYNNCLTSHEQQSVWYVFSVQTTGVFGFTINTSYDYDFALYDITTIGCSGIPAATPVRCNYSADFGSTGMYTLLASGGNASEGAGGPPFCSALSVTAGQTYALIIDNYTQDNTGYDITFGGTSSIWDVTSPTLSSAISNCNSSITVTFSEPILCTSISSSSFTLSGPGAISISGAVGVNCNNNGLTTTATVTYTGGSTTGVYTVGIGASPPTDKCGTVLSGGSVNVKLIDQLTASAAPSSICFGANSTLSVNNIATATYSWTPSAGLTNATTWQPTANAPTTTTTYTANVTYGGCTKTATTTVIVQNPPVVTISPMNPVLCSGTQVLTANATLNGGACTSCTYAWTGSYTGSANPTPAQGAGTYNVVVTSPAGCVSSMATSVISYAATSTCNLFYVSPGGGGSGLTPGSPTTLQSAVASAQCNGATIKMTIGVYSLTDYVTVNSNTTLIGGYNSTFTTKTSNMTGGANSTTIRRSNAPDGGSGINVSAFKVAANSSNFRFQDIRIEMPGSTFITANPVGSTRTNYAIYLGSACSNYNIVRCYVDAGKGANGSTGAVGANAATTGGNATGSTGGTGAWGAGGNGGTGGAGGIITSQTGGNGSCGSSGGTVITGNCGTTSPVNPASGRGSNGSVGNNGTNGTTGATGSVFSYAGGFFVPGGTGATGVNGTNPTGGCSGGGGGYANAGTSYNGGVGGGGGGAGKNGDGGAGGGAAGAAFGVFSIIHGAGNTITDCYFVSAAGTGGIGGSGGSGSSGGNGAAGGGTCTDNMGGSGGHGGTGATGGTGGTGAVGDFASLADLNGTTLTKTAYSNVSLTTMSIITATNVSCTATSIDFTSPGAAAWNFGSGATPATSGVQNPVGITYSSIGFKDIVYNGTTYYGFVDIITTAPTNSISSSATGVCPEAVANFASNQAGASGFTYAWSANTVSGNVPTVVSPTASSTNITFPNTTSGTLTFTVTLQITSQCCGIANVTKDIDVYPLPSISYVADNATPCVGGTVIYTASSVPVGASFTWWTLATGGSQLGAGNSYTYTPVVSGQNNDIWIEATNSNGCVSSSRMNADANGTATPSPTPVNGTTCSVGDVLLSVADVAGATSYNWYSANCSGLLQSGISPYYVAPNISSNTTFYVSVVVGSCTQSACVPVTATLTNINPAILTWTGNVSTDWFNQSNWDANACPPGCGTEVIIPASVTREPVIDVSPVYNPNELPAYCGKISINSARILTLNKSELQICGNYTQDGTFTMNGGLVTFNGSSQQKFTRTSTSNGNFLSTVIDNSAGVKVMEGVGYKDFITGNLTLTTGNITTEGGRAVQVTNSASNAIAGHSSSSYINGWLRRTVVASGSYEFPVGNSSSYELMKLDINSVSGGLTNITTWFYNPPADLGTGFPIMADAGKYVAPLVNIGGSLGIWVVTPNTGSADYNMYLYGTGYSGAGSNEHTIVKRNTLDCSGINTWGISGTYSTSSIAGGILTVRRNNLSGFSKFGIAKALWPLPIELIYFDGSCNAKDNTVTLSWITASETNNNFFTVERSIDGETFQQIGTVKGAGNSSVANRYSFFVQNFSGIISYYRLKQTDFDGNTTYSSVISTDCSAIDEFELINMIPNPAKDNLYIIFKDGIEEPISITAYDVVGKLIFSEKITSLCGINNKQFDVTNLSTGAYFIHITNGSKAFIKKIFK